MADNTYTGTKEGVESHFSGIISSAVLDGILSTIKANPDGSYTVGASDGSSKFDATGYQVAIINDDPSTIESLINSATNGTGGYDDIGQYATYVDNKGTDPTTVVAVGSAFVEVNDEGGTGPETVVGGTAPVFVVDASKTSADVDLRASSGYSFLIGGSGSDTLSGSTSPDGKAVLVAGSGPTTMNGGEGKDVLYGGGDTTMNGGTGAGQMLLDYTTGAHDSLYAGSGGGDTLAVASGSSKLFDYSSSGVQGHADSLLAGSGSDTLYGSTGGTADLLYKGGDTTIVSQGSDTVTSAGGSTINFDLSDSKAFTDTVAAGAGDSISVAGYSASALDSLVKAGPDNTATISFTTGGHAQVITIQNYSSITFK